jgi:hypothetical protein
MYLLCSFKQIIQGWFFSAIFLRKLFSKSCWTWSELVKNNNFERVCRWFQPFFIDISYYPLTNQVAKGYSNATICPSVLCLSVTSLWTL